MIAKAGGTMESFYYAFGDADVYVIVDLPDVASVSRSASRSTPVARLR
jgi:uncharacterized protein with GYD domain